jgi:hypothetical protein
MSMCDVIRRACILLVSCLFYFNCRDHNYTILKLKKKKKKKIQVHALADYEYNLRSIGIYLKFALICSSIWKYRMWSI